MPLSLVPVAQHLLAYGHCVASLLRRLDVAALQGLRMSGDGRSSGFIPLLDGFRARF